MTIQEYDVVRLKRAIPEHGLAVGAVGAVVIEYESSGDFEVEFCDSEGITVALLTLKEEDIEKV